MKVTKSWGFTPCNLVGLWNYFRSNPLTASLELIIQGDLWVMDITVTDGLLGLCNLKYFYQHASYWLRCSGVFFSILDLKKNSCNRACLMRDLEQALFLAQNGGWSKRTVGISLELAHALIMTGRRNALWVVLRETGFKRGSV